MSNEIRYEQFDSITLIDEQSWNALVPPGNCTGTWRFLKTLEESFHGDIDFFYFVFSRENEIVAVVMAHILTISIAKLSPFGIRRFVNMLGKLQEIKFLVCGNVVADAMHTLYCRDESVYPLIGNMLDDILSGIAKKHRLNGVLYKEFDEHQRDWFKLLAANGYTEVRSLPYHYMPIAWESIDEYKKSLKSKVRWAFNQSLKKFSENGLSLEITGDVAVVTPELYDLYRFVHEKAQFQMETCSIDFFRNALKNLDRTCQLLLLKKDDRVIGFDIFFEDEQCIQWLYVGYDGEMNANLDIYFNLSFALLQETIARKKRFFNVGQTGDSFKSRMGCSQKDKYFYFRLRNPVMHRLVSAFSHTLFQYPEFTQRNVFKDRKETDQ